MENSGKKERFVKPIIVLGSGMAGYTVIRELRKLNSAVPITLISKDNGDYYSKPMLSNAFAQGKAAASLVHTSASEIAKQLNFSLLAQTEVKSIDRSNKSVKTPSGSFEYDKLVLAMGADPIRIPLQGDATDHVLSVNNLTDYTLLRNALRNIKSVAIIGGGLIGCEFANDLATAGFNVNVIDPGSYPISGLLPEQAGNQLVEPLSKLGVVWNFGTSVQKIDSFGNGYLLSLANGEQVIADLVLSAVGLRPRIQLARETGIAVNRGIVVNGQMRSSDESIFALGDCAEIEGNVMPFVLPIMHGGRALARILNGEEARVEFPVMPVVVKTPAHPIAVLPVPRGTLGVWKELASGNGVKLGFFDEQNRLRGVALTGEFAGERNEMAKTISLQ
jgi:rubredoxin-NAD+ reductase